MPATAGTQTVVMISSDPARADALLQATKLQQLPRLAQGPGAQS
jgi:hypothetical protein